MANARQTTGAIQIGAGVLSFVCGIICIFNYYHFLDVTGDVALWPVALLFGMLSVAVGVLLVVLGGRKI